MFTFSASAGCAGRWATGPAVRDVMIWSVLSNVEWKRGGSQTLHPKIDFGTFLAGIRSRMLNESSCSLHITIQHDPISISGEKQDFREEYFQLAAFPVNDIYRFMSLVNYSSANSRISWGGQNFLWPREKFFLLRHAKNPQSAPSLEVNSRTKMY